MLLKSIKEITIEVADISLLLRLNDAAFFHEVDMIYREFKRANAPDMIIDVNLKNSAKSRKDLAFDISFKNNRFTVTSDQYAGYFDLAKERGALEIFSEWPLEALGNYLRNVYSIHITRANGLLMHASGVVIEGRAYIFFGVSGSGKSTVAKLSEPYAVLSDDLVVIKRTDGRYKCFGIPYWGDMKHSKGINASFEIKGLFNLVKDTTVYLERLTKIQALSEIVAIPDIPGIAPLSYRLLDRYIELLNHVPCYKMHFLPDASFWRCIDEEFTAKIPG